VLSPDVRVTFALKTVCGLTVAQIASGLLSEPTAIAQRLVRARRQLESARVAIEAPPPEALAERAESVRNGPLPDVQRGLLGVVGRGPGSAGILRRGRAVGARARAASGDGGTGERRARGPAGAHRGALPTRVGPDGVAQLLEDQPRAEWDGGLIALGLAHLDRSGALAPN